MLAKKSHLNRFSWAPELGGVNGVTQVTEELRFDASCVGGVFNKGAMVPASISIPGEGYPCSPHPGAKGAEFLNQ